MKISASLLSAFAAAAFATTDAVTAFQDPNINHLRLNGSSTQYPEALWAKNLDADISGGRVSLAADFVNCPNPRDEKFASTIQYARVQPVSGGFRIYYRVTGNQLAYRCRCKNADDPSFRLFFGNSKYESSARPGVRCYTKDPKKDIAALQKTHDIITAGMVFDLIEGYTSLSTPTCTS